MPKRARKRSAARRTKKSKSPRRISRPRAEPKRPAATIEFCDKCGSIMVPAKKGKAVLLKCRRCGAEKRKEVKALKIVEPVKKQEGVTILEKDITPLPMVDVRCERCSNPSAYFWLQQTRSADEPPTQFFRCTKCKYTWREYK